jgi:glycosyltransferase involved in cell wall biosynthesis
MKVVILGTRGFPNVQGGVENHCEKLAIHLAESGCNVVVLTRRPYVDNSLREYHGVHLKALFAPRLKSFEAVIHSLLGVLFASTLKPDILHIQGIGPGLFAPLARTLGMRVVVTTHGSNYRHLKWGALARLVLRFGERCAVRFAHRLIAISPFIHNEILGKYGIKSVVIPNGVSIRRASKLSDLVDRLALTPGKYILAVGRLVPEKGFHILIEAFKAARSEDWKLVIVGAADHEGRYSRDLVAQASGNSAVHMTGQLTQESLHQLYSHAGLFALPSFYEGLPIALLEAMSYGLSCIASDITGNRTIRLDEDRYVAPGSVVSWSRKIEQYIATPMPPKEVSDQIQYIAGTFDWNQIAAQTFSVYESASRHTGSRRSRMKQSPQLTSRM